MEVERSQYESFQHWAKHNPNECAAAYRKGPEMIERVCAKFGWSLPRKIQPWTKERCLQDALRFSSRGEWQKVNGGAVAAARRNGWLDECCAHMQSIRKPNGYWTRERCIESARPFSKRVEWIKMCPSAHGSASENGWLDECCAHMESDKKPNGYWTKKKCMEDASSYSSRRDWREANGTAYGTACKNNWVDECCAHMTSAFIWTKELCIQDALRYKRKSDWEAGGGSAAHAARRDGWYDECCAHMVEFVKPRGYWTLELCIASAKLYRGRKQWRKADGAAYSAAWSNGWLDECCSHMFFIRPTKWTKDECVESAKKYNTKKDWMNNEPSLFSCASNKGWLDECCTHMVALRKSKWTKEECIASAKQFSSKPEWLKGDARAYSTANRKGWIEDCCSHMKVLRKASWTKEECIIDARKYATKKEWSQNSNGAQAAARKGWIDECCAHMISLQTPKGYWTLERCMDSASKCITKSQWEREDSGAYNAARKNGWLETCCGHMQQKKKSNGYWSLERCIKSAKRFNTRKEWKRNEGSAYVAATKNGWHDICCAHMIPAERSICWTKEKCIEEARKYTTLQEWSSKSQSSYVIAGKKRWKAECSSHMKRMLPERWTLERCLDKAKQFNNITEWSLKSSGSYNAALRNGWNLQCCAHMKQKSTPKRTTK